MVEDTGGKVAGRKGVKPHIAHATGGYVNHYNGYMYSIRTWLFDCSLFILNVIFTIFFREIKVRGGHNVPGVGTPTLLVCAPHANQFIDPSLVMVTTRKLLKDSAKRSRQVCFVTAESSLKQKFVSLFGRCTGAIPVPRAQDNLKPVDSSVKIYCPDLEIAPEVIKGRVEGGGSPEFCKRFVAKSLIGLPNYLGNAQISEVVDDETLVLKTPFKFKSNDKIRKLLTEGTNFKYAAKIDNSKTFQNVFDHLHTKGCVGIFPEGGSHDRPSLLPIKAGVAIMALGAAAADPNMKVHVVPCGLHYFHRDKFRSRAVLEYGEPIIVGPELGRKYAEDPRGTVEELLKTITEALYAVTENAPSFDVLMTIQAARRLYQPARGKVSLSNVVEINRRLLIGYSKYKDDPRIIHLQQMVTKYNNALYSLGLRDHQVMELKTRKTEVLRSLFVLMERLIRLSIFFVLSLPGSILFTPIFISCSIYAKKKAKEGLSKSVVKIKGTDLIASWKLMFALVFAPILYVTYSFTLVFLYSRHNVWVSELWVPFDSKLLQFCYFYALLVSTTYSSLKTGEIGMDLFKSLPPLFITFIYPGRKIKQLQNMRERLSLEITAVINELGPKVFPNFDKIRTRFDDHVEDVTSEADVELTEETLFSSRSRSPSVHSETSMTSNALSKINSRGSLTDVPIFSEGKHPGDHSDDELEVSPEPDEGASKITALIREKWQHEKSD
ncbi:hypothetical protein HG537_0G02750 [Torulaspora globosa]|uniref:Phospholipid/glycerol acyltransferase domain-containing protein n=1 Tax=Torulaspora globosa TaxID=48254 RepID=A0A7H9HXE6_9SACH|nr:hypothetical protein HG537_0G02750 [Torulaspora sp. CBS 2947]